MNFKSYCQQAFINLLSAKLRSVLAVLGILVGTAAVVALISCGQLATAKALEQFKALGTDLLAISAYQKEASQGHEGQNHLSIEGWRSLPDKIPGVLNIAPYALAYQPISAQGVPLKGAVIAADDTLAAIIKIQMAQGHFVSFVDSFEHYCVIGSAIADQLKQQSLDDPIGKPLRIGKTLYTIIGIARPWQENAFFNEDINQAVIIPLAGVALINKDTYIDNAVLLLKTDSHIDEVIEHIKAIIATEAPKLSIFVRSARQIIAGMENQGRIFTLLLAIIGSISLLVGGIGVMNVMLASVAERKKEIGIRKAIGAKNKEIQTLFLVEAVALSLAGGVLGVLLGLVFTWFVAYFNQWTFAFYALPILTGFVVSVVTGIFFGFYPARRAAVLEPMASLRAGI